MKLSYPYVVNYVYLLYIILLIFTIKLYDHVIIAAIAGLIFLIYFNRFPNLFLTDVTDTSIIKPCAGKLDSIKTINNYLELQWFLALTDIHSQYVPVSGKVISIKRIKGSRFDNTTLKLIPQHTRVTTKIRTKKGAVVTLEQLSGVLTNKIHNFLNIGDHVTIGQPLGKIDMGSRCILTIPLNYYNRKVKNEIVLNKKSSVGTLLFH